MKQVAWLYAIQAPVSMPRHHTESAMLDAEKDGGIVIPPWDKTTGHIPSGRYLTSFDEIQAVFVDGPEFTASATRPDIWEGFRAYIASWEAAQDLIGARLLLAVWIGGSFISSALNPSDIDVSPVLHRDRLDAAGAKTGVGNVKKLIGHRDAIVRAFRVEPFPVDWVPVASSLNVGRLAPSLQSLYAKRGATDEWWGRVRPPGPRRPPEPPSIPSARGYLEVLL